MTLSLSKLQTYAKIVKKTKVIKGAYRIAADSKSATFVLESGPKLTMTEAEIDAAIEAAQQAEDLEQAIEEARQHAGETEAERKARLKREAKARKEQGDE